MHSKLISKVQSQKKGDNCMEVVLMKYPHTSLDWCDDRVVRHLRIVAVEGCMCVCVCVCVGGRERK